MYISYYISQYHIETKDCGQIVYFDVIPERGYKEQGNKTGNKGIQIQDKLLSWPPNKQLFLDYMLSFQKA